MFVGYTQKMFCWIGLGRYFTIIHEINVFPQRITESQHHSHHQHVRHFKKFEGFLFTSRLYILSSLDTTEHTSVLFILEKESNILVTSMNNLFSCNLSFNSRQC